MDQPIKGPANRSDERRLLHDIATPLSIVILTMDMILEGLQKQSEINLEEILQMSQVTEQLEKIKALLVARREILIARGISSTQSAPQMAGDTSEESGEKKPPKE